MNITKSLIARIESARLENKTPCKSYATEENAEKVAAQLAQTVATHVTAHRHRDNARSARYVVVFVPSWGRWVCGFDMTELMSRSTVGGMYLGVFGDHFTF